MKDKIGFALGWFTIGFITALIVVTAIHDMRRTQFDAAIRERGQVMFDFGYTLAEVGYSREAAQKKLEEVLAE